MHCDTFKQDNYSTVGGDGDVGLARYEPALLPPCPTIRALCYSKCQRSTHSHQQFKGCYASKLPLGERLGNYCLVVMFLLSEGSLQHIRHVYTVSVGNSSHDNMVCLTKRTFDVACSGCLQLHLLRFRRGTKVASSSS